MQNKHTDEPIINQYMLTDQVSVENYPSFAVVEQKMSGSFIEIVEIPKDKIRDFIKILEKIRLN